MPSANERQVAGSHYNGGKVQHWDYVQQALDGRYLEGNITKYVTRHRKKNGLQDLQKAEHYLDKLIEEFRAGHVAGVSLASTSFPMAEFISDNGLNSFEAFVVKRLAYWYREDHLEQVRTHIHVMMNDLRAQENYRNAIKAGAFYVNQD